MSDRERLAAARAILERLAAFNHEDSTLPDENLGAVIRDAEHWLEVVDTAGLRAPEGPTAHSGIQDPDLVRLVSRFAAAMEERLAFNDRHRGKYGWEEMSPRQLLQRAEQELGELRRAVERNLDALDVAREAADVGNFCAMVATVYEASRLSVPEEAP